MMFSLKKIASFLTLSICLAEMSIFQFQLHPLISTVPSNIRDMLMRTALKCALNSSCLVFSITVETSNVEMFDGTWFDNKLYKSGKIYGEMMKTYYDFSPAKATPVGVPISGVRVDGGVEVTYIPNFGWSRCTTSLRCNETRDFHVMDLRNNFVDQTHLVLNTNMDGADNWGPEYIVEPWSVWPFVEGVPFTFRFTITSSTVQVYRHGDIEPYTFEWSYGDRTVPPTCISTVYIWNDCSVQSVSVISLL